MRLRRYLLGILIVGAGLFTVYLNFDRMALFTLSKLYDLDISYKSLTKDRMDSYAFENLKVMNKKMGLGFYSQRATIKPIWKRDFLKAIDLDFKFKDVHFVKGREESSGAKYDTVSQVAAMPFEGRWAYKEIAGEAEIFSNGLTLKRFSANGREIRLNLSGDIFYNNVVDVEISIYFSKDALKDIPPELHTVIMSEEPNEWKSFSLKIKGSLSSPSMQISGKLFRLNFGTVTVKD
ncbi:MAG: hypothetical protein NT036_03535 [Candidatus Omnitrophica bacterium]|nr:hypothetical protein [Candidatus Omnitrophota bacterium]